MNKLMKDNWIPLAISLVALVLATIVGLIPVLRSADDVPADPYAALEQRLTLLEGRLETLGNGTSGPENTQSSGIDPTLRAELDQIVTGLVNQTGRISRLKKDVSPVLAWGDSPPVPDRIEQQLTLINNALLKQTARIRVLQKSVAPVEQNRTDLDRIALQIKNLESAVKQLHKRVTSLSAKLNATGEAPSGPQTDTLTSIEAKLDAMLKAVQAQ